MEKVKRKESLFVESVVEALWDLLKDTSFDKIRVSELVERAGVGRVTFTATFPIRKRFSNAPSTWNCKPGCQSGRWTCRIGRMVIYY